MKGRDSSSPPSPGFAVGAAGGAGRKMEPFPSGECGRHPREGRQRAGSASRGGAGRPRGRDPCAELGDFFGPHLCLA